MPKTKKVKDTGPDLILAGEYVNPDPNPDPSTDKKKKKKKPKATQEMDGVEEQNHAYYAPMDGLGLDVPPRNPKKASPSSPTSTKKTGIKKKKAGASDTPEVPNAAEKKKKPKATQELDGAEEQGHGHVYHAAMDGLGLDVPPPNPRKASGAKSGTKKTGVKKKKAAASDTLTTPYAVDAASSAKTMTSTYSTIPSETSLEFQSSAASGHTNIEQVPDPQPVPKKKKKKKAEDDARFKALDEEEVWAREAVEAKEEDENAHLQLHYLWVQKELLFMQYIRSEEQIERMQSEDIETLRREGISMIEELLWAQICQESKKGKEEINKFQARCETQATMESYARQDIQGCEHGERMLIDTLLAETLQRTDRISDYEDMSTTLFAHEKHERKASFVAQQKRERFDVYSEEQTGRDACSHTQSSNWNGIMEEEKDARGALLWKELQLIHGEERQDLESESIDGLTQIVNQETEERAQLLVEREQRGQEVAIIVFVNSEATARQEVQVYEATERSMLTSLHLLQLAEIHGRQGYHDYEDRDRIEMCCTHMNSIEKQLQDDHRRTLEDEESFRQSLAAEAAEAWELFLHAVKVELEIEYKNLFQRMETEETESRHSIDAEMDTLIGKLFDDELKRLDFYAKQDEKCPRLYVHDVAHLDPMSDIAKLTGHTTVRHGHLVHVFGGLTEDKAYHNGMPIFNSNIHQWNVWQPCVYNRAYHSAVVWSNKMIIYGGIGPGGLDCKLTAVKGSSKERHAIFKMGLDGLSIEQEVGSPLADIERTSQGHHIQSGYLQDVIEYDFNDKTWNELATVGDPSEFRAQHTAVIHGSYMYVFGGWGIKVREVIMAPPLGAHVPQSATGSPAPIDEVLHNLARLQYTTIESRRDDLMVLNLQTHVWTVVESMGIPPSPRSGHASIMHQRLMYVFGGMTMKEDGPTKSIDMSLDGQQSQTACVGHPTPCNDIYTYNVDTKEWQFVECAGQVPSEREGHSIIQYGNSMLMVGGRGSNGRILLDIHQFVFPTSTWREIHYHDCTPMRNRFRHTIIPILSRSLYEIQTRKDVDAWRSPRRPSRNGTNPKFVVLQLLVLGGRVHGKGQPSEGDPHAPSHAPSHANPTPHGPSQGATLAHHRAPHHLQHSAAGGEPTFQAAPPKSLLGGAYILHFEIAPGPNFVPTIPSMDARKRTQQPNARNLKLYTRKDLDGASRRLYYDAVQNRQKNYQNLIDTYEKGEPKPMHPKLKQADIDAGVARLYTEYPNNSQMKAETLAKKYVPTTPSLKLKNAQEMERNVRRLYYEALENANQKVKKVPEQPKKYFKDKKLTSDAMKDTVDRLYTIPVEETRARIESLNEKYVPAIRKSTRSPSLLKETTKRLHDESLSQYNETRRNLEEKYLPQAPNKRIPREELDGVVDRLHRGERVMFWKEEEKPHSIQEIQKEEPHPVSPAQEKAETLAQELQDAQEVVGKNVEEMVQDVQEEAWEEEDEPTPIRSC